MLNKLKFNNLVITNKKGIQESRIQTINRLVRKIRKLKSLSEKHPIDTKCKERIRRSTETMEMLKKIKRLDVMKKVLLLDKPASAVITNGISSPEEVAVALLSMNKIMQGLVKRFKTELQLNASKDNEWKKDLMESSKRKQKIERTEEKRRRRLELKQQKMLGRNRQKWLEENQHLGENISEDSEPNISTTGRWKIEEISTENNKGKLPDKAHDEQSEKLIEKKSNKEISALNKKHNNGDTTESHKFEHMKINKDRQLDYEINKRNENCDDFASQENENSNNSTEHTAEHLTFDPFFITDSGESYKSTAVIRAENLSEKKSVLTNSPFQIQEKKKQNFIDSKQNYERNPQNIWRNKQGNSTENLALRKLSSKSNAQMKKGIPHKELSNSDEKNLHPSWRAKQKLKPIITGFQGKKIKFEDDNCDEPNTHKKYNITQKPSKTEEGLHPSWAAKQKLKPSITAFQGKKITFDDNE